MGIMDILKARAKGKVISSAVAKTGNNTLISANKTRVRYNIAKNLGGKVTGKFKRPKVTSAVVGLSSVGEIFGRNSKKMSYAEQRKAAREMQESKVKKTREKGTIRKAGERLRGLAKKKVDGNANKIYWAIENNVNYDAKQKKLRVQLLDFVHDSCLEGASKKEVKGAFVEKRYPSKLTNLGLKYYDGVMEGV